MGGWTLLLVSLLTILAGCDKAKEPYLECQRLQAEGKLLAAFVHCKTAVDTDPDSTSGQEAQKLLPQLQKLLAARKAAAEKARLDAAKVELESKIKQLGKLSNQLYDQAMWDMGRGTNTLVIDVMSKFLGEPEGTYATNWGATANFVWGADLGSNPTVDQIMQAPLAARMVRDLACRDYAPHMVDFYSYGQKVRR